MNEINLKRIDDTIDGYLKKKTGTISLEMLVNLIITKFNTTANVNTENQLFENILIKLIQGGFGAIVKSYCYFVVTVLNKELSSNF